jgi:ribosomal protein L3
VSARLREWPGAVEITVRARDETGSEDIRSLAYTAQVGDPNVGDRVILNTTAWEQELGTGGYALVVALPDRLPTAPRGPGHLVKSRYTPSQATVLGVDEENSPHHELLRDADDIAGMPVIVADLHSALPAILVGLSEAAGETRALRVVYVMTDGGALPMAFSRTVPELRHNGSLVGSVTVGQAYGGDLEAVTVHMALLAARHVLNADVTIVTQGPGNLGTGTRWGFSGVASGDAVNAVSTLGGQPVIALRISEADPRPRHRGVSHHSVTAYGRVALARGIVAVPELPGEFGATVKAEAAVLAERHDLVSVNVDGLLSALRTAPAPLSSMGRGLDEDRAYFLAAAAAGRLVGAAFGGGAFTSRAGGESGPSLAPAPRG